jgi:hypothetical protein
MIADKILLYGAALMLAIAGTALVAQTVRVGQLRGELATTKLTLETERRTAAEAAKTAVEQYRIAELRQSNLTLNEVRNAHSSNRAADVAGARAAAAGHGLRVRAEALAARCGGAPEAPAVARGGSTAAAAGHLLADMSRRLEEAGRELADVAERSLIAGTACQHIADGEVTP